MGSTHTHIHTLTHLAGQRRGERRSKVWHSMEVVTISQVLLCSVTIERASCCPRVLSGEWRGMRWRREGGVWRKARQGRRRKGREHPPLNVKDSVRERNLERTMPVCSPPLPYGPVPTPTSTPHHHYTATIYIALPSHYHPYSFPAPLAPPSIIPLLAVRPPH